MSQIKQNWINLQCTVQGARKSVSEELNQDCVGIFFDNQVDSFQARRKSKVKELNQPVIVSVADGHGGANHPFSRTGAKIAVEVAIEHMKDLIKIINNTEKYTDNVELKTANINVELDIFKELIVRKWENKVIEVAKHHEEISAIRSLDYDKSEPKFNTSLRPSHSGYVKKILESYGTTVMISLLSEKFGVFMQLGDGGIFYKNTDGFVSEVFDNDKGRFGTETYSLCQGDLAVKRFKCEVIIPCPEFVLIATDGFTDAYSSNSILKETVNNLYNYYESGCHEDVAKNIESWLAEITKKATGDDITISISYKIKETPIFT